MIPGTKASIKSGIVGGSILLFVSIAFAYSIVYLRDQMAIIGAMALPGYALAFIAAGILAAHFSHRIESAAEALRAGAISGGATALVLVAVWIILSTIMLMYVNLMFMIGLTFEMIILVMVGIAISAIASLVYAFIDNNFDRRKE